MDPDAGGETVAGILPLEESSVIALEKANCVYKLADRTAAFDQDPGWKALHHASSVVSADKISLWLSPKARRCFRLLTWPENQLGLSPLLNKENDSYVGYADYSTFTNVLLANHNGGENFGVAIILFTLLIADITYPLTAKQLFKLPRCRHCKVIRVTKMMEKYRDNKKTG